MPKRKNSAFYSQLAKRRFTDVSTQVSVDTNSYVDSSQVFVNTDSHMDSPRVSVDATNLCMDSSQDPSPGNK